MGMSRFYRFLHKLLSFLEKITSKNYSSGLLIYAALYNSNYYILDKV